MIVSIAVVAYNEEAYLPKLLEDILDQDYPKDKTEVLLIDSCSKDQTLQIMENFANGPKAKEYRNISVLPNPKGNIPAGNNIALKNYTGDAIIRIDAHARIPKEFIRKNAEVLERGELASGGKRPCLTMNESAWAKTLLIAENSKFGSGGASYRGSETEGYEDSLFCGMYRREVFERVGLYDERLPRSEDNEMSFRMRKAGIKLHYDPGIIYYQYMRSSLKAMLKQKFGNGKAVSKTTKIAPGCFTLFHFVPFVFVLAVIVCIVVAALGFPWLLVALFGLYFIMAIAFTILGSVREGFYITNLLLPGIFLIMHICYGTGTIAGFFAKV